MVEETIVKTEKTPEEIASVEVVETVAGPKVFTIESILFCNENKPRLCYKHKHSYHFT